MIPSDRYDGSCAYSWAGLECLRDLASVDLPSNAAIGNAGHGGR
jgi:hypothetical protein